MALDRADLDRAELERDLRRVADRLRTAPLARLTHAEPDQPSSVARAHDVLTRIADLAAGTDARDEPGPPLWREVPDAGIAALGDQVTVLGTDLVLALRGVPDDAEVWTRDGRAHLSGPLADLAAALRDLRMSV